MSMIRLRFGPRDIRRVDVRAPTCPQLLCFYPSRHTTQSAAGASGCSSRSTQNWECGTRERQDCPPADHRRFSRNYSKHGGIWEERPEVNP